MVRGYLRGADACVFVYDCTSTLFGKTGINTYVSLPEWLNMFDSVSNPNAYRVVVGNKFDCEFNGEAL